MIINIHSQLDKPKESIRNRRTLKLKLSPVLSDQIIFAWYLTNKQLLRKFAKTVTWRCKFRVYEHLISKDLSSMSSNAVLLLLFILLSGLMLFPGKKCHNSGHQLVVLGIVAHRQIDWTFSLQTTFLRFLVHRAWSCAATIVLSVSFFKYPFFNQSHNLLLLTSSVAFINCPCRSFPSYFSPCSLYIFSLLLPHLLFSMILLRLTSFNIFSFE